MNRIRLFLTVLFLYAGNILYAQYIQRVHSDGCAGRDNVFVFTLGSCVTSWSAPGGQITQQSSSQLTVHWNSTGTYAVSANYSGCNGNSSNQTDNYSSISITSPVAPSVSITGTSTICQGTSATFTATPTNGGSSPSYKWLVNGTVVYTGGSSFTSSTSLVNGDVITSIMSSNSTACLTQYTATSNAITMTVTPRPVVTVTIGGTAMPLCGGMGNFWATASNAVNPTYTWYHNSHAAENRQSGTADNVYVTSTPFTDTGVIYCVVTSTGSGCVAAGSASSNVISISTTSTITPSINLSPSSNSICASDNITFTASPHSAGYTLSNYSWQIGSNTIPANTPSLSTSGFSASDDVKVTATASGTCLTSTSATGEISPNSITVRAPAAPPNIPLISSNACYAKTLSYSGTPPAGTTWYWQGENSNGSDKTSATATNPTYTTLNQGGAKTYYIRGSLNNCWGPSTAVTVTVDNPAPPNDNTISYCEWDNMTLTTGGMASNLKWHLPSGQLLATSPTYTPTNLAIGSYSYKANNVSAAGCEGTVGANINLTVRANCDDNLNWTESITYGTDASGNPIEIGHSKSYADGMGNVMQSQAKNYTNNQILASQPVNNSLNAPVISTLPAPINATDFVYRYTFVTNANGQRYSAADFDQRITPNLNSAGEIKNPNPVGNTAIGTLGWYYSTNNTMEPFTATTAYPYSRSYTPEGPNPTMSTSSTAGDAYKMGSGHESKQERQTFLKSELSNYFLFRSTYVKSTLPAQMGTNMMSNADGSTFSGFTPNTGVDVSLFLQGGETYVKAYFIPSSTIGTPGVSPIGGPYPVTPGSTYTFRVKGFNASPSGSPVRIVVRNGVDNSTIVWPGSSLPNNEDWIENTFTAPANCTSVKVGLLWQNPVHADAFYLNTLSLSQIVNVESMVYGYKMINTDPDGKKSVSFVDFDGHTLASALITATNTSTNPVTYTYDNTSWSYSYYNDLGQVVATAAPKGIVMGSSLKFVTTYLYDNLGRLIETTSPDEGTSQFVYSTDGKIRFSQSQAQRDASPKRFSYTNYDYLGRMVEAGEYTQNGTNPYVFESASTLTNPLPYSILSIVDKIIPQGKDIETIIAADYPSPTQTLNSAQCTDYTFVRYDLADSDLPTGDASHAKQNNLIGQVSKTKNANATTWYSYDETGALAWSKQSIAGLGNATMDYTYDFMGNVTQVLYQKDQTQTDKFYHFYTYDADQRLSKVETSLDGTNKTLQARYFYYLHGPLKRVELATNLQGIDYTYTLQGALKSINHMDIGNDPGTDGATGTPHAGFSKDLFGLTLSYYDNDFASAGHIAGNISPPGSTNNFGGLIKSVGWSTPVDNTPAKRAYNYTYDSRNQLQNAQWGTVTGTNGNYATTLAGNAYKEGMGATGYDANGNVMSMVRYGRTGNQTANYTYTYETDKNRVDKINDGTQALVDYTYNGSGQMISYVEASNTMNVHYNAYGLVKEVLKGTTLVESFLYDDQGNRVAKIDYTSAGAIFKTTYYVHDATGNVMAVYEKKTAPVLIEVPIYGSGRLGEYKPNEPGKPTYYELNDNLGNVRTVIGASSTTTITATMESENATVEDKQFRNIAPRTVYSAANSTAGGNEAVFLNNARLVGPTTSFKVSPGDVVTIDTYAYYEGGTGYSSTTASAVILNAIISAFGGVPGAPGDPGKIANALTNALSGGGFAGFAGSSDDGVPAAYLNMIMFDGNMLTDPTTLPMSALPVTTAANGHQQHITIGPITIPAPGTIYVYVNNNSNSANRVYFDDLKITQLHSPFVAGGDYYPYGLAMEDRQIKIEPYRFGYQGQYAEKDSASGWNNFELRMYDARFGRWLSPDPAGQFASPYVGMGNVPNMGTDPDGAIFGLSYLASAALIGGISGTVIGLAVDPDHWYLYTAGVAGLAVLGADIFEPEGEINMIGKRNPKMKSPSGITGTNDNFEITVTERVKGYEPPKNRTGLEKKLTIPPIKTSPPNIQKRDTPKERTYRYNVLPSNSKDYTEVYKYTDYNDSDKDTFIDNSSSIVAKYYKQLSKIMNVRKIYFLTHTLQTPNPALSRIRKGAIQRGVPPAILHPSPLKAPGKNFIDVLFVGN